MLYPLGKPPCYRCQVIRNDRTHDRYVMTDTGINTHLVYRLVSPSHRLPSQKVEVSNYIDEALPKVA